MKNRIKYLFLTIVILTLIFPRSASADFFGIVDLIAASLEGVEETAQPVAKILITIFFSYIIGIVSAFVSAALLQNVTDHPEWLSVNQNALVDSGWHFTSGIANIFIILILIIIAFTYILKIETFQAKQALPRLIIVALLINFSLVFVGMLVDVSNIFYNTILKDNAGLPIKMVTQIGGGAIGIIMGLIFTIAGLTLCFMIPIASTICQSGLVFAMVSIVFLPNVLIYFFQIFGFFLVSSIFFTYAFIFAARVFVIELLAILSPIAFLCLILPQTKKYWDEWLGHLIQWITLGIILFFFLTIGLKAVSIIKPPDMALATPGFSWFILDDFFKYYFFLFVYLVIALWLSKRTTPTIASFMIEQGKALAGFVWTTGMKPLVMPVAKRGTEWLVKPKVPSERMVRWAKGEAEAEKAAKVLGIPVVPARVRRWAGRTMGPAVLQAEKERMERDKKEAEKLKDPTLLVSELKDAAGTMGDLTEAISYLTTAITKGGPFKEMAEKEIKIEDVIRVVQRAQRIGAVPEAETIARAYITKENLQNYPDLLKRMGFKEYADLTPEKQKEWTDRKYKTALHNLIGETKGDEIKDFAKGFWESADAMEAVQNFWGGPQIRKAADEFHRPFVEDYMKPIEAHLKTIQTLPDDEAEKGYKAFVYTNPRRARYLETNAAQELGYGSIWAMAPEAVKRKYNNIREVLAEMP